MKIVVTGASGFVGSEIYPRLKALGVNMLLVGRFPDVLQAQYPDAQVAGYDQLAQAGKGYDVLLHLAVQNNDQSGTYDEFEAVNVTLLKLVADAAVEAGIGALINMSTLHVHSEQTNYALSKLAGEAKIANLPNTKVVQFRVPAIYGSRFQGRLRLIYRLPRILQKIGFQALAALRPTLNVDRLVPEILKAVEANASSEVLLSDRQEDNYVYRGICRLVDLSFVLVVFLGLWWLLIAAWALVRFSSPGPAIFSQERIGKNGQVFRCHKFRTMAVGTKQAATHEVSAETVTWVGRFLRRVKLDELPQAWNVLRNEMCLVGPRPCLPIQHELIAKRRELGVLDVKPGITGLAQVEGIDMSNPSKLARKDAEYLVLQSLPLNLRILFATVRGKGGGDQTHDR